MSIPAVSIVLPTYDRLQFLPAAIESVEAQSFRDWELIVADDGSGEETREYLQSIAGRERTKVLSLAHSGNPGEVRNRALAIARGEYVAFLDSDDVWMPDKLEIQLGALRARPDRQWSYTALRRIDDAGNTMADEPMRLWRSYEGFIFEELLTMRAVIAMPTVMVKRELLQSVGGFDPRQDLYEDYDLWLRLVLRSDVGVLDEPLACVRNHKHHYSYSGARAYAARCQLLDKLLRTVDDPSLRRAVRRQRARSISDLANAHAAAGCPSKAAAILASEAVRGSWTAAWWRAAMKLLLRPLVPSVAMAFFRRMRDARRVL
jgi:glycosyltransferase involved in cell wall biosynthesis